MITCRHAGGVYQGGTEVDHREPLPLDALVDAIAPRWVGHQDANAADLGMLVLDHLADTYRPAHRELYAWLETWELDFNERVHETEQRTLKELRGLTTLMRVRLLSLAPAVEQPAQAWFVPLTSKHIASSLDDKLRRSLRELTEIADALRSSFQVLTAAGAAERLRLAQEPRERSERLDDQIPRYRPAAGAHADRGIYSANPGLPSKDEWSASRRWSC